MHARWRHLRPSIATPVPPQLRGSDGSLTGVPDASGREPDGPDGRTLSGRSFPPQPCIVDLMPIEPTAPVMIAWVAPPELERELAVFGPLSIADSPADWPGAPAALIDTVTAGGVEVALVIRRAIAGVAVIRCQRAELAALLARIDHEDDVALADDPPQLLYFRLLAACRRAHPTRDGLTGLPGPQSFSDALEAAAAGTDAVSVIVIDVNRLKLINDRLGHAAGDAVLREVAHRLGELTPRGALLARAGGEQYGILCAGPPGPARLLADQMLGAIRARPIEGEPVTASAGIAASPAPIAGHDLLRDANEALFAAKAAGRNRSVHWDDLRRDALAQNRDPAVAVFENRTRVLAERVAESIAARGRRMFADLRLEADQDGLTGLYTRRYLDRRAPAELDETRRAALPLTLALIDVDLFRRINKHHGWPSGDRVLAETAERIRRNIRAEDWVARYGGDEICVVMRGADLEQARVVLERIRRAIADQPIASTAGQPLQLTVSIGAAQAGSADDLLALVERASQQLLKAKRDGRNQVCP